MLDAIVPAELGAVRADHSDPAVVGTVGLVVVMDQLDREVRPDQPLEEGPNPECVVVPPPSVHVGTEREGDGGGGSAGLRGVEGIQIGGVSAGHGRVVV